MARPNMLEHGAARELLAEAASRNQSLDMVRLLEGGEDACRSRFIEAVGVALAVEVPSRHGRLVPVRPGERVEVFFRLGADRYWFQTGVRERTSVTLSGGMVIQVLALEVPPAVQRRQRRRHVRVRIAAGDALHATLRLAEDTDGAGSAGGEQALGKREVLDLSAGGARLLWESEKACPLVADQAVRLRLPLEAGVAPMVLDARVKRVATVVKGTDHVAVEFADLDASPEGRMMRDQIARHVAAREREELRRMRGLA